MCNLSMDFRRQAVLLLCSRCCTALLLIWWWTFSTSERTLHCIIFQGHGVHEPSLMCLLSFELLYLPNLDCLSSTVFDNFPFKGYICVLKLFFILSIGRFYEWRCSHSLCRLYFLLHNLFWKSSLDFFLDSYHVKNLSNQLSWPLVWFIFVCYFLVCHQSQKHWCSRCFTYWAISFYV